MGSRRCRRHFRRLGSTPPRTIVPFNPSLLNLVESRRFASASQPGRSVFSTRMNEEKTPTRAKELGNNKEKLKQSKESGGKVDKQRQRTATQELKARQRAEIYALNKVMTELEQRQFEEFRRQMLLGEAGGGNQTSDTEVMPACRI